jgi:cobalt transport protein ATP-binding subunit
VIGLTVKDLTFAYPDRTQVLNGITFQIDPGERVALLGPNGAGKTTLLLHLNGLLRPQSGTIEVGDLILSDAVLAQVRRLVGFVFQDPDDQLFMPTVAEDVAFGPRNFGFEEAEVEQRVTAALAAIGEDDLGPRAPHHLSGGERRKVAIATILATDSKLLVLDEPTSNLDPAGRRELVNLLSTIPATQLVVSHDLPFVLELCPRSLIVDQGRIVADGETRQLLADRDLLARHRLELPYGFDPANIARR